MPRKYILFILFIFSFQALNSKTYQFIFDSFNEIPFNLRSSSEHILDANGDPTALLIIQIPTLTDIQIASPLKVQEKYDALEFSVYLGQGTKRITVKHPDFEPFEYNFDEPLKAKRTYKLTLQVPEDYLSKDDVSVKISTNVVNATLAIDNQILNTDNGEFILRLGKGEYNYTLSANQPDFQAQSGTLTVTDDDIKSSGRIDKYIVLTSTKKCNLHIANTVGAEIIIDGENIPKKKKMVSLSLGKHKIEVSAFGFNDVKDIYLINENEQFDVDLRIPLKIVSPSSASFTLLPLDNALPPSATKFKAGEEVKVLGKYKLIGKAKGYYDYEEEITAYPDKKEIHQTAKMTSNAHDFFYGAKQNKIKAAKEYLKLINKGDNQALWEWGQIKLDLNRVDEANKFIRDAADKGHPEAAFYTTKNIVRNNPQEMEKYLRIAIEGGNKEAHLLMGDLLKDSKDIKGAYEQYLLFNNPDSRFRQAELAMNYPEVIKLDRDKIIELLKSIEKNDNTIDNNYAKAQKLLGDIAYNGDGKEKDLQTAIKYWQNVPPKYLSQEILLIMCVYCLQNNNETDLKKYISVVDLNAISTNKEIFNGYTINKILTKSAQIYDKKSVDLAFRLVEKAYSLGDLTQITLSYLGKYYKEGKITSKNSAKAKTLLKMTIDKHNDVQSMRLLGHIYEQERDYDTAKKFYLKAIELGDNFSKGYYGALLYNQGKEYRETAIKYLTEAANNGHQPSIRNLIIYYDRVAKDQSKARYWRSKQKNN